MEKIGKDLDELEAFVERNHIGRLASPPKDVVGVARVLDEAIDRLNSFLTVWRTVESYVYCIVTTTPTTTSPRSA